MIFRFAFAIYVIWLLIALLIIIGWVMNLIFVIHCGGRMAPDWHDAGASDRHRRRSDRRNCRLALSEGSGETQSLSFVFVRRLAILHHAFEQESERYV